jgi:predicted RNA binding protein YcfA (HicA-like mRNA interferase family)
MSSKSPRLTAKEIIKQLKDNGFVEISQSGSHKKLFHPETRRTAIVPFRQGKVIPIGTIKSIKKQSGIIFS